MITSPADENFITRPENPRHVVRGTVEIRAKAWNGAGIETMTCSIDGQPAREMKGVNGRGTFTWHSHAAADGRHEVSVRVTDRAGREAVDTIFVLVSRAGDYEEPRRSAIDYENAIGAYPHKGIVGTQLGPNENGTKGPWPSWRAK